MIDLITVVEKYPESLESPAKFQNYLKDLYPEQEDQVRIKVLTDAMNCGIVDEIRRGKTGSLDVARYRTLMEQKYGYSSCLVFECVTKWIKALESKCPVEDSHSVSKPTTSNNPPPSLSQKILATMHTHVFSDIVVAPTCLEHGYTLHRCKCGYERKDQFTPFGEHSYELVDSVPPTCTESGRDDFLCAVCSDCKSTTTPAIGHQFADWVLIEEANCMQGGILERTCTLCEKTERKKISAAGHKWSEWADHLFPTCTEDGVHTRQCLHCGLIEEKAIKATGHVYSEWEPSRTHLGKYERFCQKCGNIETLGYNPTTLKITGHELKSYTGNEKQISIPNHITRIGEKAFCDCSNLKSITIPNGVKSIGAGAFSGCGNLSRIKIPISVTSIEENAFSGCSKLKTLTIPSQVGHIGKSAFTNCSNLTSVCFENTIQLISEKSFSGCISLTDIAFPASAETIGDGAFSDCSALRTVIIPSGVKIIGSSAFQGCRNLSNIALPNTVEYIGKCAFSGCRNLNRITIPGTVRVMESGVFSDCDCLRNIYFEGTQAEWNNLLKNWKYPEDRKCLYSKTIHYKYER